MAKRYVWNVATPIYLYMPVRSCYSGALPLSKRLPGISQQIQAANLSLTVEQAATPISRPHTSGSGIIFSCTLLHWLTNLALSPSALKSTLMPVTDLTGMRLPPVGLASMLVSTRCRPSPAIDGLRILSATAAPLPGLITVTSMPFTLAHLAPSSLTRTCCLLLLIHQRAHPSPKLDETCISAKTPSAAPGVEIPSSSTDAATQCLRTALRRRMHP